MTVTMPSSTRSVAGEGIRVAAREILDVTYRAMRVAGASTGEGHLAAQAVLHAEVAGTDGLALLLDELPTVTVDRIPGRLRREGVMMILDDPAGRSLFYSVPAAAETCRAGLSDAVLVPAARWRPAVRHVIDSCIGPADVRLHVVQVDHRGEPIAGDLAAAPAAAPMLSVCLPAGLLVWIAEEPGPHSRTVAEASAAVRQDLADASRTGIVVDRQLWAAANTAARGYLVPERQPGGQSTDRG